MKLHTLNDNKKKKKEDIFQALACCCLAVTNTTVSVFVLKKILNTEPTFTGKAADRYH